MQPVDTDAAAVEAHNEARLVEELLQRGWISGLELEQAIEAAGAEGSLLAALEALKLVASQKLHALRKEARSTPAPSLDFKPLDTAANDLLRCVNNGEESGCWDADGALPRNFGPYVILREIGRGGMGVVYLARHRASQREVALKVIPNRTLATQAVRLRFQREARALAQVRHLHLISLYEVGKIGGRPYYTMNFVDGQTFRKYLQGRPTLMDCIGILAKVASAVETLHARDIVHRDLKPENVMIDADGQPYVMDFGLAKHLDRNESRVTRTGAPVGTPAYMAPEQAAGRDVRGPADVYALGVILYEVLTGRPPHQAGNVLELMRAIRDEEPEPPSRLNPDCPAALERICLKAIEKLPGERYASAGDLHAELLRFLGGEKVHAAPRSARRLASKWFARRRRMLAALALALFSLSSLLWVVGREVHAAHITARWAEAHRRYEAARALFLQENYEQALSELEVAVAEAPRADWSQPLLALGRNLYKLERYDEAVEVLARIPEQEAEYPKARLYRGECLKRMGRLREARDDLQVVLKLSPLEYHAHHLLAEIATRHGDLGEANTQEVLFEVVKAMPDASEGLTYLDDGYVRALWMP